MSIYKNDVGDQIVLELGINIDEATVMQIRCVKPGSGSSTIWAAGKKTSTSISYVTKGGDISAAGGYKVQAYVETPDWKKSGSIARFIVIDTL